MENQATININRIGEWMNRARAFKVFIDGQQVGTISNGTQASFPVAPGTHKVECKVDWCSSREFEVKAAAGETVYLQVQSGMKYYWQVITPMLIMVFLNFYFVVSKIKKPFWFDILLGLICLPAAGYLLYYTAFSRKDYLLISYDSKSILGK
jgi:Protein of unknown function (DUF2846)